ncbi:hypothetical protein BX666DRAFT_1877212 [Dichotomocladium elegans]|nr:hypothetical protein BX666DRAFT_1877212 [Dichotomocladium elegans]
MDDHQFPITFWLKWLKGEHQYSLSRVMIDDSIAEMVALNKTYKVAVNDEASVYPGNVEVFICRWHIMRACGDCGCFRRPFRLRPFLQATRERITSTDPVELLERGCAHTEALLGLYGWYLNSIILREALPVQEDSYAFGTLKIFGHNTAGKPHSETSSILLQFHQL